MSAVNTKTGSALTGNSTPSQIATAINAINTSASNRIVITSKYAGWGTPRDYCQMYIYRNGALVYTMYFNALPESGLARDVTF